MKLNVIGLTGYKGAGKNTAGQYIYDELVLQGYSAQQDMMAAGLKNMLEVIGYPCPRTQAEKEAIIPELGVSWRHMAQTLGTEWRQLVHPHLWLIAIEKRVQARRQFCSYTIVTDVRFGYEAEWVRKNGWLVHVLSEPIDDDSHVSERPLSVVEGDFVIANFRNKGGGGRSLDDLKYWCEVTARTFIEEPK